MRSGSARLAAMLCGLCLAFAAQARDGDCRAERDFCAAVARYAKLLRVPGYALAVARNGRIVYEQADGYADLERRVPVHGDSIFPVASITKTFTAALMMQYVEEGRIRLDDHVADYPQIDDAAAWLYGSADIRLKHILSHTSEGARPGSVFSYNGNRFNYVYGVFAMIAGEKDYARAFAGEVTSRVLDRIGLRNTLPGYPDRADDARVARIVTPYRYDRARAAFVADDDLQGRHRHAHPNSGMLSTAADLARYVDALDEGRLVAKASVAAMTAPFELADGTASPYGLGWFAETWNGLRLDWVYGLGPSYSSFLLHVPEQRLTLIFLANTDAPTAALRLNYGDALQFPLAAPFLRRFAAGGRSIPELAFDSGADALATRIARLPATERPAAFAQAIGIAATWQHAEAAYGSQPGRASALVSALHRIDPEDFRARYPELIGTIADIADRSLAGAMNDLAAAYEASGRIDPRISQDLADFRDRIGEDESAARDCTALLAAPGYETSDATIRCAFALGDRAFRHGDAAAGRAYYWTGIRDAVLAGWGAGFAESKRQRMTALAAGATP